MGGTSVLLLQVHDFGPAGLPKSSIVTRITDVTSLPSGVAQLTNVFTDASNHVDDRPAIRKGETKLPESSAYR
jgi:hypothetical protein